MGLMADLGGGPVGVDTAIFIYFIEEHPQFLPLVEPLFREVNEGRKELVASALTLLEVLVVPYRSGDHLLAGRYEALLTQSRGVHVADISRDHLRAAAQLRAARGVKTPDSLQVVAALAAGCTAFLTHNRDLPTIPGLRSVRQPNLAPLRYFYLAPLGESSPAPRSERSPAAPVGRRV